MTSLAVNIQTYAVGTWNSLPGISYTLPPVTSEVSRDSSNAAEPQGAQSIPDCSRSNLRRVDVIGKSTEHSAKSSPYDLSPELCLGSSAQEVAGLEILHEVPRLQCALWSS